MDRVVDAMHAAGSRSRWDAHLLDPALAVREAPRGHGDPSRPGAPGLAVYGPRQNMDITHPVYRQYAERVIRRIAERYAKHPGVIGWQITTRRRQRHRGGRRPGRLQGVAEGEVRVGRGAERGLGPRLLGPATRELGRARPRDGISDPGWKLEWERYQRSLAPMPVAGADPG